jgi:hypothetical protein
MFKFKWVRSIEEGQDDDDILKVEWFGTKITDQSKCIMVTFNKRMNVNGNKL